MQNYKDQQQAKEIYDGQEDPYNTFKNRNDPGRKKPDNEENKNQNKAESVQDFIKTKCTSTVLKLANLFACLLLFIGAMFKFGACFPTGGSTIEVEELDFDHDGQIHGENNAGIT